MKQWNIDPAHSQVTFRVKHLVVATVTGRFGAFDARIESSSGDFSDAAITFEADTAAIDTGNAQRDDHLRSPDFFDAAKFPKVSFASRSIERLSGDNSEGTFRVAGDLTIHGVTRPVILDVAHHGTVAGFGGTRVAGFEITGKINRFDFGLKWNALTEAGGVVVGEAVKLDIHAEFTEAAGQTQPAGQTQAVEQAQAV